MKYLTSTLLILIASLSGACTFAPEKTSNNPEQAALEEAQKLEPLNGKKLDLSSQNLDKVPANVFSRRDLDELDLSYNKLTGAIPAEIRHLSNLKVLKLDHNQMTGVPAEVGQLSKLENLDLSYNKLTGLPQELANLKNLKTLNLKGNNYSSQDLEYIRSRLPNTNFILN
jgi:Leucine-rich repeat (LRR) protein